MYRLPSGLAMAVLSDAGSFGWEDRFTSCHCEVGAVKKRFEGAGLYGLLPKTSIESFYLIQKIKGHHIKLTGLPVKYDVAFFSEGKGPADSGGVGGCPRHSGAGNPWRYYDGGPESGGGRSKPRPRRRRSQSKQIRIKVIVYITHLSEF